MAPPSPLQTQVTLSPSLVSFLCVYWFHVAAQLVSQCEDIPHEFSRMYAVLISHPGMTPTRFIVPTRFAVEEVTERGQCVNAEPAMRTKKKHPPKRLPPGPSFFVRLTRGCGAFRFFGQPSAFRTQNLHSQAFQMAVRMMTRARIS